MPVFTWVHWQGVKAERNSVVVQMLARDEILKILVIKYLNAGFPVSDVLEHVYSLDYPYDVVKKLP